ncbi:MAG: lytic murein transglycosylase [Deltaproteobacteria bacterium]|nr:lytic murein transglycosylase [Deltaproteobacteria bacterium]
MGGWVSLFRRWVGLSGKARNRVLTGNLWLVSIIMLIFVSSVHGVHAQGVKDPSFQEWLKGVRREARAAGVSPEVLDRAFRRLKPIPRVIKLDRSQPEFKLTFKQYQDRVVSDKTVWDGRRLYREHRDLLKKIGDQYGVEPQYIVALWGIETRYGRITGGYPVIAALATLAYDGRRSAFFREELIRALKILEEGHIDVKDMDGSWAGAMGQVQFMPSSFVSYAVDYDGDGRRDIWDNVPDALASAANYLSRSGWKKNQGWGGKVSLPAGFNKNLVGKGSKRTLKEWQQLGVTGKGVAGKPDLRAYLVQPNKTGGPIFLAYPNYRVILKWNRSNYFAITVGTLADRIAKP